jgi:hypothetical protein
MSLLFVQSRKGVAAPTAALLLIAMSLAGCFDHRRSVAFATLVDQDGIFHEEAYAAAIAARFPPGSPIAALTRYVQSNHGQCNLVGEEVSCRIPLRGVICGAELAAIKATQRDGKVVEIHTIVGGLGC